MGHVQDVQAGLRLPGIILKANPTRPGVVRVQEVPGLLRDVHRTGEGGGSGFKMGVGWVAGSAGQPTGS